MRAFLIQLVALVAFMLLDVPTAPKDEERDWELLDGVSCEPVARP